MDFGGGSSYRRILTTFIVVVVISILFIGPSNASIHIYDRQSFRDVGNAYLLSGGSEGLFSSSSSSSGSAHPDTSSHSSIQDYGYSYIKFENISFVRTEDAASKHSAMELSTGLVQVVIFEVADRDHIGGSAYGGQRSICCTPDLAKLENCKQGEVLSIPSSNDINWPIVLNIQFGGNYISANMDNTQVFINKTGMYNLFFIACDPELKGLTMSGKTYWKNPDGYLPGRMAPLMEFYMYMCFAYLLLGIIWFTQNLRFWNDVLQLQHCISVVIALGLFEMTLWYFEYANFNRTGIRPIGITTWVVTIGAIRKTLSRLLILCVSMGYGVVKPTLGGLTSKVILLGFTYFIASELLDITEYVGTINDISGRARLFLVLPNACLDAFLILWIFTSLSKTLEQLQAKRSSVKLDIYRMFSNALLVMVIVSIAWTVYEVYFKATDPFNENWRSAWIIIVFWHFLAFVLLCVICCLWAPSQNSQRYSYSDRTGENSDDEEAQSLTRGTRDGGDVSLVKQQMKEKNDANADDLYIEDEESEEGKRE